MRILCVIDCLGSGGAQRQLVELAMEFKDKGHEVVFLTYFYSPFYNPVLEQAGIIVECLHESNYFRRLFRMRRYIRRGKYNVVLSFLETPGFICEFSGFPYRNWKLVVGERCSDPKILHSTKLILYRWFHLFSDYIVANSNVNMDMVKSINKLLPGSKCSVIHNIIDFRRWNPSKDYIPRKSGRIKLIVPASHIYRKNLNGLLDALALMSSEEQIKITIEWYGDSITEPYCDHSIVEAFEKINRYKLEHIISLKPATHNIDKIIQEADAVGLFSFAEGLPNAVCEGMACAKPIICSTVSDVPILLSHEVNLLCNPEEPQSIKRALCNLINMSDEELIRIGVTNENIAREQFDKELVISSYLQLFEK